MTLLLSAPSLLFPFFVKHARGSRVAERYREVFQVVESLAYARGRFDKDRTNGTSRGKQLECICLGRREPTTLLLKEFLLSRYLSSWSIFLEQQCFFRPVFPHSLFTTPYFPISPPTFLTTFWYTLPTTAQESYRRSRSTGADITKSEACVLCVVQSDRCYLEEVYFCQVGSREQYFR